MIKKITFFIVVLALGLITRATTPEEFIQRVNENYTNLSSYSVQMNYSLYKGFNSRNAVESQSGFYAKSEGGVYSNVFGFEQVSTDDFTLNVDHTFKVITISNSKEISPVSQDIKSALKLCSNTIIKELDNGSIKLILDYSGKRVGQYRKIEFVVDKDYWIQELTLYSAGQTNFSKSYFEDDYDYSKLKIKYFELRKKWKDKEGLLNPDRYIINENGTYSTTQKFSAYNITDLRRS